jgi:capsular polysaccharide biosynthesis protein
MAVPTKTDSVTTANGVVLATVTKPFIIENTDANRLHVLLDNGNASATNFSFSLAQNEKFEVRTYKGVVKGIWAGDGAGSAFVTELT